MEAKNPAFPSHQTELQDSDMIHPQQRMLYEWISPATPTKLCFDIDSSDPSILESVFLQETLISTVVNRTVNLLQEMDIDCSSIQWYMMDSSRASKFSVHLSCNFYFHEPNFCGDITLLEVS